jgi:hypothetical protein
MEVLTVITPEKKSKVYFVLCLVLLVVTPLLPLLVYWLTDLMTALTFLIYFISVGLPLFALLFGFCIWKTLAWSSYANTLETCTGVKADWSRGGYPQWRQHNQPAVSQKLTDLHSEAVDGNEAAGIMFVYLHKAAAKLGFSTNRGHVST